MDVGLKRILTRAGLIGIGGVLLLLLGLGAATAALAQQQSLTLTLGPGRDATQPGMVTLTAQGQQTLVVLNLTPGAAGVAQPAHIHEGACPGVGGIIYPLTNIMDGKSTTVVDAPLSTLLRGGFAVNTHKGPGADANIYTACVNLPAAAGTSVGPAAAAGGQAPGPAKGPVAAQAPAKGPVNVQAPAKQAPVAAAPAAQAPRAAAAPAASAPVAQAPAAAPRLPSTGSGGLLPQPASTRAISAELLGSLALLGLVGGLALARRRSGA